MGCLLYSHEQCRCSASGVAPNVVQVRNLLELALKAPSGISFWISDYSVGLPTTQRRGSDLIAAQGSDETLVVRKYTLGKPAQ